MIYSLSIHGISCASCIEKISTLLKNKLHASKISFNSNNKKLNFTSPTTITVNELNNLLIKTGNYRVENIDTSNLDLQDTAEKPSYKPIYIIFIYLALVNAVISFKDMNLLFLMPNFMASFFFVFSFFKILDLKGFAEGYSSYDVIARKFFNYGYIYPFLELSFGIVYLLFPLNLYLNIIVFFVMIISSIGVIKAKFSKQKFECACVGTFLKVPLGNIAIIEDLLMVIMSLFMIVHLTYF